MTGPPCRPAAAADLPAINALIDRAIATWNLSDRLKRLARPAYRYEPADLDHLDIAVVGAPPWGVRALEGPDADGTALLHGLFVDPDHGGRGHGSALLADAEARARAAGASTLLVKAQAGAAGFFRRHGFRPSTRIDYPHALEKPLSAPP